ESQIEYQATTDEQTLSNPTNHVYLNLTGNPTIPIDGHELQINAQKFVPLDERALALGELASTDQRGFDLQKPKKLAEV
ncbi:galactose-1-epimerase, partial [Enterococcus faecalis]